MAIIRSLRRSLKLPFIVSKARWSTNDMTERVPASDDLSPRLVTPVLFSLSPSFLISLNFLSPSFQSLESYVTAFL